jgi:hypothetical protein
MGLSLSVLPEDVAETPFDESEMQFYVSTLLLFSIVVPQVAARAAEDERVPAHPAQPELCDSRHRFLQACCVMPILVHISRGPFSQLIDSAFTGVSQLNGEMLWRNLIQM